VRRFARLLGYVRPYRVALLGSVAASFVAAALDGLTLALLIPFLRLLFDAGSSLGDAPSAAERVLQVLVGPVVETGDRAIALRNVVVLVLVTVALKNVALYAADYLGTSIQEGISRDLRAGLYRHLQSLGLGFYHRTRGGQLVSRIVADADQAKGLANATLVEAFRHIALVAVYLAILLSLSWRLSLVTLLLAPVVVLLLWPILSRVRTRIAAALDDRGEMAAVLGETVEGARVVKAHGAEAYERRRFTEAAGRYLASVLRARRVAALASPLSETLGAAVILLLLLGSWTANPGGLRPELFVTFVVVSLRMLRPVKLLSQFPVQAENALAAAARIFEIVDTPSDDVDPPGTASFPGLADTIEFRDVWVSYEGERWVLSGVSLTVRRGEVLAIVGPSGAGKSTLVDLLPRFVEPGRGAVLVDGVPVTTYGRRSLRAAMGVVSQHTVLFNDTVRANIAYGDQEGASLAAVEAAARAANAHRFIERLPRGYDSLLGERGMRLSGGERQRIAIARALLRDAPILILDEATSALDPESERPVQEAIGRLLENRTVFVIAHRLSTVARAYRIAVLDGGRLVECGRHHELARAGGLYHRLLRLELAETAG
jgi:subfamily B ATP-binding cassette protein MsbA